MRYRCYACGHVCWPFFPSHGAPQRRRVTVCVRVPFPQASSSFGSPLNSRPHTRMYARPLRSTPCRPTRISVADSKPAVATSLLHVSCQRGCVVDDIRHSVTQKTSCRFIRDVAWEFLMYCRPYQYDEWCQLEWPIWTYRTCLSGGRWVHNSENVQ